MPEALIEKIDHIEALLLELSAKIDNLEIERCMRKQVCR